MKNNDWKDIIDNMKTGRRRPPGKRAPMEITMTGRKMAMMGRRPTRKMRITAMGRRMLTGRRQGRGRTTATGRTTKSGRTTLTVKSMMTGRMWTMGWTR